MQDTVTPLYTATFPLIYVQSLPKADVVEWLATEAVLIIERYTYEYLGYIAVYTASVASHSTMSALGKALFHVSTVK